MQFTNQIKWTLLDFVAAGALLLTAGLILELILRRFTQKKQRIIFCFILFTSLLLIWAELAVGIFN